MPTALETLVKILRLEQEQRCKDSAVEGGLGAYSRVWEPDALRQARNSQQQQLVEELRSLMQRYSEIANPQERRTQVQYMLDRIHARVPSRTRPADGARRSGKARRRGGEGQRQSPHRERRQRGAGTAPRRSRRPARPTAPDIAPPLRLARPPRQANEPLDPAVAAAQWRELEQPVTALKGTGEKRAELLARLDARTLSDLLYMLPRRHDDYRQERYLGRLEPGVQATVVGRVRRTGLRSAAGGRRDFLLTLEDASGRLDAIFFGRRWLAKQISVGDQIVLSGRVSAWGAGLQMANPEWEPLDPENLQATGLVPVYALTEGLTQRSMRRMMREFVTATTARLPDPLPNATLERAELAGLGWALRQAHFPEGHDHLRHARNRLVFDELLLLQLGVLENRREWQSTPATPLETGDDELEGLQATLFPFELTAAQQRAIADIRRDLAGDLPMNRLLQGDVGSGKTAVAALALALAARAGGQGALIVPLSVLAGQHYRSLSAMFARLPEEGRPSLALLTGATPPAEREVILDDLASGALDLVVGTQALIQEGVEFHDLGLAVIDEQHRFGVQQRKALRRKGRNPHLLLMTATPIPRSLALTIHADLDLTVIDELPPGRKAIETTIIEPVARERAFGFVEAELARGRQAFVVHPLVEKSERIEARDATGAREELARVFHRHSVALLHGRMSAAEKNEVLSAFSRGDHDVLVTTSAAEVGVDVPNASVMVIEGASRFGLAQLHQFRGRVGRGEHESRCLLIPDEGDAAAWERLQAMEDIDDGFRLAELDWRMRGPGDLVGTRQSGGSLLQLADSMTPELVTLARQEAGAIHAEDPDLALPQHGLLAALVARRRDRRSDLS